MQRPVAEHRTTVVAGVGKVTVRDQARRTPTKWPGTMSRENCVGASGRNDGRGAVAILDEHASVDERSTIVTIASRARQPEANHRCRNVPAAIAVLGQQDDLDGDC